MSDIIDIDESKFKFKIKGELVEISQPTLPQELEHETRLQKIQKEAKEDEPIIGKLYEANIAYLVSLGAPEKVLRGVSRAGFMQIINHINGVAKKK